LDRVDLDEGSMKEKPMYGQETAPGEGD